MAQKNVQQIDHPKRRYSVVSQLEVEPIHYSNRIKLWSEKYLGLLIMLLLFLGVIFIFYPFQQVFEIDPDEGINLIKGMLVEQGYPLYREIWSDQPPLFTYFLAFLFRVVGYDVAAGRILVLLLSCALIFGFYTCLRMVWGNKHALSGTLILILLPTYLGLSVSVMIGLPSIALAMLSLLALTTWHQHRNCLWLILSAIALCLSIYIKIFTSILVPVFVVGLLLDEFNRGISWSKAVRPPLIWVFVIAVAGAILGLVTVGPQNVWQLVQPHLAANEVAYYYGDLASYSINRHLRGAWPILLLGFIGSYYALKKRRWLSLYPLSWMILGYIFLFLNTPARNHHQLLVTVPAALLAGVALGEMIDVVLGLIKSRNLLNAQALLSAVVIFALALILMARIPWIAQHGDKFRKITEPQRRYVQKMYNFAPQTNWVITDKPMYAFRVGLSVPPEIAVMTRKRVDTGFLTDEQIIDAVKEWKPEQILLGRFNFPELERFLEQDYRLIHSRVHMKLYIRKDL
jgi:4-amino-4-deoxy-L-arabinose transferase-like glycosyltransferase